jgi:cyclopropane-fatty-acyl-phospholipid synthase
MMPGSHAEKRPRGNAVFSGLADWCVKRALSSIVTRGNLTVMTASGRVLAFGDGTGEPVRVRFADDRAQWAFLIDADMRLGELYMDERFIV